MKSFAHNVHFLTEGLRSGLDTVMNLAGQGGDPSSGVFFVNFNQDNTSLAVGTKSGYKLFSLNNADKLEQIYESGSDDICIVERLFSSSLVALVCLSSPRKLRICHFKKGTEICNYSYSNTILAVKLNRARLVVCLEESLYIHNIRDMAVLHTIRDTPPNPSGLCALTTSSGDSCYLAYPGSSTIGEVQIFDSEHLSAKLMIPAHDNPLAALSFNPSGTRIATASDKGTVIRVFSIHDGTKLYEFRRGVKRCVSIYSLAFSEDSLFLCASSNTETVHIFKLEDQKDPGCNSRRPSEEPQGWMGYVGRALMSSANYLPTQVTDMLNQGRAFASIRLPFQGLKNICAVTTIKGVQRVVVAAADGYLYIYNLDANEGGECTLEKQHRLDGKPEPVAHTLTGQGETGGAAPAPAPPTSGATAAPTSTTPAAVPISVAAPSYASTVRNTDKGPVTEAEKLHEIATATADTHMGALKLSDEDEFPPMGGKRI